MGIKQLYNDNLRKLPNEYGDVSVMVQLSASGRLFKSPDEPRYHHHDLHLHVAVSRTLNASIICSRTLFDTEISSLKKTTTKTQRHLQLNKNICTNCNGDIRIYTKNTYLQF